MLVVSAGVSGWRPQGCRITHVSWDEALLGGTAVLISLVMECWDAGVNYFSISVSRVGTGTCRQDMAEVAAKGAILSVPTRYWVGAALVGCAFWMLLRASTG